MTNNQICAEKHFCARPDIFYNEYLFFHQTYFYFIQICNPREIFYIIHYFHFKNIFPFFFNLMNYLLDGTYFSYFHHKNCDCIPIKICSIQKMSILLMKKIWSGRKDVIKIFFKKRKIIMKFNYFFSLKLNFTIDKNLILKYFVKF